MIYDALDKLTVDLQWCLLYLIWIWLLIIYRGRLEWHSSSSSDTAGHDKTSAAQGEEKVTGTLSNYSIICKGMCHDLLKYIISCIL